MDLTEIVAQLSQESGDIDGFSQTVIPGLFVMRSSKVTRPQCMLYSPALCLIVQGAKEMAVGTARASFGAGQSLVTTRDVPTMVHITQATPERPFLGIGLELNLAEIRAVMEHMPHPDDNAAESTFELLVDDTRQPLRECIVRLIDASRRPYGLAVLHASIMREIYYWLLTGPNGARIARQIGRSGPTHRIALVIAHLRETFRQPVKVEELADLAHMSLSSLFQHFKAVTSMTPLQFQKHLRLLEARHLLVMSGSSVAQAANHVGYESTSQFSREYRRMFGLPPGRDTSYFYDVVATKAKSTMGLAARLHDSVV